VITIENYARYLEVLRAVVPLCDGILASMQPLVDLSSSGSLLADKQTYLSLNRTGIAGSDFELDDRLVTSVGAASEAGFSGVKFMVRIDLGDGLSAAGLELLGRVLEEARGAGLDAMVESLCWRDGRVARDVSSVVLAAVIAHDIGSPLLKVPVPDASAGEERTEAVSRVVQSVGAPVLFLGGPRQREGPEPLREQVLAEARDVVAGGGRGMAVGRVLLEDPQPEEMTKQLAAILDPTR
jgi:DhnA family fructose-bisphosphate aldolase class Ia